MSICTNELLSGPKITTYLPQSKLGYEKCERESNPIRILKKNIYLDHHFKLT